jgi:hypothetical protein
LVCGWSCFTLVNFCNSKSSLFGYVDINYFSSFIPNFIFYIFFFFSSSGYHNPTDVVGGMFLGICIIFCAVHFIRPWLFDWVHHGGVEFALGVFITGALLIKFHPEPDVNISCLSFSFEEEIYAYFFFFFLMKN